MLYWKIVYKEAHVTGYCEIYLKIGQMREFGCHRQFTVAYYLVFTKN